MRPVAPSTGTIASGATYLNLASALAPNFQGYVIARCNFGDPTGFAFAADKGIRNIAIAESAESLTTPRDLTVRPLLFSSLTNQNGLDSRIGLLNTSGYPRRFR